MRRSAVAFVAPRRLEIIEEELAAPTAGHVLVRTRVSAISAGTELLAYRGELPADLPLDETLAAFAGSTTAYPLRYGYAAVGDVAAVGAGVPEAWIGRRVFSFQPHASAFVAPLVDIFAVPEGMPVERAALFANMETAVSLVLDGAPRLGERVAVVGQGTVGLLATSLLSRCPLETLVVVEPVAARARLALALGAARACATAEEALPALRGRPDADGATSGADLTFELSGNPAAPDAAIALTGREGRVVVGSFYGDKRAAVDLGGHFHRGRLTLASSQVSRLPSALTGRWDRARRRDVAWRELARLGTDALIGERFALGLAADAYATLDAGPGAAPQILLTYE